MPSASCTPREGENGARINYIAIFCCKWFKKLISIVHPPINKINHCLGLDVMSNVSWTHLVNFTLSFLSVKTFNGACCPWFFHYNASVLYILKWQSLKSTFCHLGMYNLWLCVDATRLDLDGSLILTDIRLCCS